MRLLLLPLLATVLLTSCSKKGADSAEGLRAMVEEAVRENKAKKISKLVYWEGGDPEIRKMVESMMDSLDFEGMPQVEVTMKPIEESDDEKADPGVHMGRKLKWLAEPTHRIEAYASNKDAEGNGMKLNLTFVAGEVDGQWRLIGMTYGEPPRKPVEIAGLTDTNATAIAYNDEGEILDFVHIEPGQGIQEVVFHAPDDGSYINVTVVGPARDKVIPLGTEVATNNEEMMRGAVSVNVQEDKVVGIFGNRVGQDRYLTEDQLKQVKKMMEDGHQPSKLVEIIKE